MRIFNFFILSLRLFKSYIFCSIILLSSLLLLLEFLRLFSFSLNLSIFRFDRLSLGFLDENLFWFFFDLNILNSFAIFFLFFKSKSFFFFLLIYLFYFILLLFRFFLLLFEFLTHSSSCFLWVNRFQKHLVIKPNDLVFSIWWLDLLINFISFFILFGRSGLLRSTLPLLFFSSLFIFLLSNSLLSILFGSRNLWFFWCRRDKRLLNNYCWLSNENWLFYSWLRWLIVN